MNEQATITADQAESGQALLRNIARGMAITADLSRADLLLLEPDSPSSVTVRAQAQPHSIASLYDAGMVGRRLSGVEGGVYNDCVRKGRTVRLQHELRPSGASVMQHVYPIRGHDGGDLLALFSIETTLIQLERHRHRHHSFRRAIEWLKVMCMAGELAQADQLSAFGEMDGVMLVDGQQRISYVSGIANNLYRRLGYLDDLRGKPLSYLHTRDDALAAAALVSRAPQEQEVQEGTYTWIRKALPVWSPRTAWWAQGLFSGRRSAAEVGGVLIMVHDATDERRKKLELKLKSTMVQEVHHRVKNNLQAITGMLRMQARRTKNEETLQALREAISRIQSVAVIHEYLSLDDGQAINLRDACQRIVVQNRAVTLAPGQQIRISVEGPAIYLPSQQATSAALVINELINNAIEHGYETPRPGEITVSLVDGGDRIRLEIWDDGDKLPAGFDLSTPSSLGLQIVRSLVQDDLRGVLTLDNRDIGVVATVDFPKVAVAQERVSP